MLDSSEVEYMQEKQKWRELLGELIHNSQEKQRIANALGVSPITLVRWANNDSNPRPQNLSLLFQILPQYRHQLLMSASEEFGPSFTVSKDEPVDSEVPQVSSAFYASVLQAYSAAPRRQRFWSISNLILQQALGQLDPGKLGVMVSFVQCVPPVNGQKVRSLHGRVGRGTPPWQSRVEQQSALLGIESLAGYVTSAYRPLAIQSRSEEQPLFSSQWTQWEESVSACPVMFDGRIAGCLLVSCALPHYFLPFRQTLIRYYAELMVLALEPDEFYQLSDIELRLMPSYNQQEAYFAGFRQRVKAVLLQAAKSGEPITITQAEELVLQQLEEELLRLPPTIARP